MTSSMHSNINSKGADLIMYIYIYDETASWVQHTTIFSYANYGEMTEKWYFEVN